ncbi:hypothetical protein BGZ63DRAFT_454593 [Mariannaea sp. PMI_226]|nr:hypothetical protein BGZ63DRAFT_454593 [Mariannaea sp. PMI_226]
MAQTLSSFKHRNLCVNEALFNHLALPPVLPHRQDPNIREIEDALSERALAAAQFMRDLPSNELYLTWDAVARSLQASKKVHGNGNIDRSMLARELNALHENDFLILHVRAQNCALFLYRSKDTVLGRSVIFEAFEASARNEDILAAENALQWTFPGCAVAVPESTFLDPGFISNVSTFLDSASRESIKEFSAHALKAGASLIENRNTPEPSLITSMLMALLQENGRRIAPTLLEKMVRDDVCWRDASTPWRRLPYWLILRVAICRYLCLRHGAAAGRAEYKFFITHLLGNFLSDIERSISSIDNLDHLRKKISRRIVKLETDVTTETKLRFRYLFTHLEPTLKQNIETASSFIEASWTSQKLRMRKSIPILPRRASPDDTRLDLRVSGPHLQNIMNGYSQLRRRESGSSNGITVAQAAKQHLNSFARAHAKLLDEEAAYRQFCSELPATTDSERQLQISETARCILSYIDHAPKLYNENPHLLSTMIINVMELWAKLDCETCNMFPLLREFHPIFRPDMLDVLLASHSGEMQRLQKVQLYLKERIDACNWHALDIFADPVRGSFGHRFYEESPDSSKMAELHNTIELWAKAVRLQKETEWRTKSSEFTSLSKQIDQTTCMWLVDEKNPSSRGHDEPNCPRCYMKRKIKRLNIVGYEHPLPADQIIAKAVIFELTCPQSFATYRDVTWKLISKLALPPREEYEHPKCTARDYEQLCRFANGTAMSCTLASKTKSFLQTHYSRMDFPVEWESGRDGVCRPNGLKLSFFDSELCTWPKRRGFNPSFLSHVKVDFPQSSPFSKLLKDSTMADNIFDSSSYEIISTTSKCPSGINIHEYLAFQTIASGKARRWLAILTELGSANLNFSNEATMLLLSHLAAQCGPAETSSNDPLRIVHKAFRDRLFCQRLLQQLSHRLDTLSANWRETSLMETVISLTLRVLDFSTVAKLNSVSKDATILLGRAREICVRWFKLLRAETFKVTDAETAQRFQQYTLWAGLLCKHTFALYDHLAIDIEDLDLEAFIQSSIMVQDSLVVKLTSLPKVLRHAVFRDMRLSHVLCNKISLSIISSPDIFRSSLREVWPEEEGSARRLSSVTLEAPGWISCLATTCGETNEQNVLYNCAEGVLLVDGRPMGKLPNDPKKAFILNELFQQQVLLTYPSDKPGMQYVLCLRPKGFQVHVGYTIDGELVVRAFRKHYSLQLIPRGKFMDGSNFDLPGPLIDNSFHWLNLRNGEVLISKQPWPKDNFQGYKLNLQRKTCTRAKIIHGKRIFDSVVNPYSPLFFRATRILDSFENSNYIMVVQPGGRRHLQVELPRLQILFHVNDRQMLKSPQLQVEIDPIQDAGTWYGLRSKLVCTSTTNPLHKSILVPLGNVTARVDGCHVEVRIAPNGVYGKFTIDETLGRLSCAAEPLLIYTKALLHALTSFILPDPLTGRTGAEEAVEWLQSGMSQPWCPLGPAAVQVLRRITQLTPRREYYPSDLRVMRTDHFTNSLPIRLQSSAYRPIIGKIVEISQNLTVFSLTDSEKSEKIGIPPSGNPHLHTRALLRQQALERLEGDAKDRQTPVSYVYKSRDRPSIKNIPHRNVLDITHSIRKWPQSLETTSRLAHVLAASNLIGGFESAFDKASLNDRLRVNIVQNWGSLVIFMKTVKTKYDLMFLLGLMAFRLDADMPLLRTLLAFAIFEELKNVQTPIWSKFYVFQPGQVPQLGWIMGMIQPFGAPPPEDDTEAFGQLASWPCLEPNLDKFTESLLLDIGPALETIRPEWERIFKNMDLTNHIQAVQEILDRRISRIGYELREPVSSEDIFTPRLRGELIPNLNRLLQNPINHSQPIVKPRTESKEAYNSQKDLNVDGVCTPAWPRPSGSVACDTQVLSLNRGHFRLGNRNQTPSADRSNPITELETICKTLETSRSAVRRRYAADFQKSLSAFRQLNPAVSANKSPMYTRERSIKIMSQKVDDAFLTIQESINRAGVNSSSRQVEWLKAGGLWPAITKRTILGRLSSVSSQKQFGTGMKESLIHLGVCITELQREIRLHDMALKEMSGRYHEEESNQGHANWKPAAHPDWLLLEIESNIMIRPVQIDVAFATISPESELNSVLQMNMGQGKTSCIIPMAAAALADRTRLVRVVVPKALLQQTAQLLQSRLGGILGRQIRHVPFSRRTPTSEDVTKLYHGIHRDILKTAGIMICQPEHNMSFMLSGRQKLLDAQIPQAGPMIKVQNWLMRVSRDILDESDYTLAVRTQLIYPSGSQMTVDGHPHRWLVAEAVLRLVDGHLFELSLSHAHSISVVRRQGGGFPLIFFLRPDVEDELIRKVTTDICSGLGGILPINSHSMLQADRVAIKDFISAPRPRVTSISRIQKLCPDNLGLRQTVYLLRGLLVNRILMMTLKKRWNVEYGLHPKRDPIAVPFHAKGVPSEQSEWGHPDVAILFTCLAFYYDGVNISQLKQCLEHILKLDDPSTEYDKWTKSSDNFPSSLKAWNSINVDDEIQLAEIWKVARYNGVVIDYFLNNFVFPRHAKQFRVKLQSNGWDIPLFPIADEPHQAKKSGNKPLTTGFSGTNDNRTMLPLNIKQQDLSGLLHTSAEVLTYLLHPRNRHCVLPSEMRGSQLTGRATELDLLHSLKSKGIRVLIDAGAQILEMNNLTLAQEWLKIDGAALAALYFDEGNRPWVVTRQGNSTPLLASPFADDLQMCLVYLDEAHTRGTDLRLPPHARGALTLRLGQTKDHTVQAAMRLRQLGTTQSITFFIPLEVHQSIADLLGKSIYQPIDSGDVIEWLLDNTSESIEQLQPLYYSQGMDFCRRMQASLDYPKILDDKTQREKYVATIKQEEQQTLQQLYDPKPNGRGMASQTSTNTSLQGFINDLNARRKAFQDTGRAVHGSALQEVEQEREVAFEVESVRQVKKAHHYAAFSVTELSRDLESFARTGRMPADANYFTRVLSSMANTGLGRKFQVSRKATESKLYVTAEFDRTIKQVCENTRDNFLVRFYAHRHKQMYEYERLMRSKQRPVNWVLWSPVTETAVVVIPEEAEALIPMLRDKNLHFSTHLLTYAAPVTRKMLQFNDLDYYSIPPLPLGWTAPDWLRVELGLFAGRLYFEWREYEHICTLLGVEGGIAAETDIATPMDMDGAVDEDVAEESDERQLAHDVRPETSHKFASKPLTFVQEWLAIRRRGQDYAHSPMGFLSQGKSLQAEHLFFTQATEETPCHDQIPLAPVTHRDDNDGGNYDGDDDYQGVDDMGANKEAESDVDDDHIVYDESEYVRNGKARRIRSG